MGLKNALEFAEASRDGTISLRAAVTYQLRVNSYPPIPHSAIDFALEAIEEANRGAWDKRIDVNPNLLPLDQVDFYHRKWGCMIPVREFITGWHLQVFVDWDGSEEEVD